jgi:hypothetical protein
MTAAQVDISVEAVERYISECGYGDDVPPLNMLRALRSALTEAKELAAFNKSGWDGAFRQAMENGAAANELRSALTAGAEYVQKLETALMEDHGHPSCKTLYWARRPELAAAILAKEPK